MKKNQLTRFSLWSLLVVSIILLTAGCGRSGEDWDGGLLAKDHLERPRTSAEVLALFASMSIRFDNLLENLEGAAPAQKKQQLMQRLAETTTINLSAGDMLVIQSNQQQIINLSAQATPRAAELSALLDKQAASGEALTAEQIILLDRLLEQYAKDIEELLLEAEASKANQLDNLDVETLKGFSAPKYIRMQELEIKALDTLKDYLREANRILV